MGTRGRRVDGLLRCLNYFFNECVSRVIFVDDEPFAGAKDKPPVEVPSPA